ncbi:MAG: HK97 family phage prohead protease [Hyphomicrobiales bacterium]
MLPKLKSPLNSTALEVKFSPVLLDEVQSDGIFEGYASVFDEIDSANDVVAPGAFRASLAGRGAEQVKMLFQHDPKEVVGIWLSITEDARGLRVRGRLLPEIARAAELLALMRAGALDGLSIGFRTVKGRTDPKTGVRSLTQIDLWEISLVTFPMLPTARIAGVKGRPPTQRELERWLCRDAGFTRSQAKAVIAHGYQAAGPARDARMPAAPHAHLIGRMRSAARLMRSKQTGNKP